MQTKIFDLESENKRMQDSLELSDQQSDQNIRLQAEQELQPKIDFKDQEVQQMTEKLAKISMEKGDLFEKISKLEQ